MSIAAVLLAGGTSRRMGRDKAFLTYQGQTLWERQLATLEQLAPARIVISANASQNFSAALRRADVVIDPSPESGPLAAIEHCLSITELPTVFLAVDMPSIEAHHLPRTPQVFEINGRFEPLAALYSPACLPHAHHELTYGKGALQPFVRACAKAGLVKILPAPDPAAFANWNAPSDLPNF